MITAALPISIRVYEKQKWAIGQSVNEVPAERFFQADISPPNMLTVHGTGETPQEALLNAAFHWCKKLAEVPE